MSSSTEHLVALVPWRRAVKSKGWCDTRNLQPGKNYGDKAVLKEKPSITEQTSPAEGTVVTWLFHVKPTAPRDEWI